MRFDNPNRPEPGFNLNDEARDLGTGARGDAAHDGYTTQARRPRTTFTDEMMSPERADRIEQITRDIPRLD